MDRAGKPKAQSGRERRRGVELGHSTCEAAEHSRWRHMAAEMVEGKPGTKENDSKSQHVPDQSGRFRVPGAYWYTQAGVP
jgi:hypothetical protein